MKQNELSLCLRGVVLLIGAAVIFLAAVFIPLLGDNLALLYPGFERHYTACVVYVWLTLLPFLSALGIAWRIFSDIGRDMSFSLKNANRLRLICYLALADTLLYIIGAGILAMFSALHPGVLVVILCVIFMGFSLCIASAALSHLCRKAALLKDENDLTI